MTNKRLQILELLAKYKYLCRSQFHSLGLQVSRNHFTNIMKSLVEKPVSFIGQKKFGYHPNFGKVEDLYYLKTKGKQYLINEYGWNKNDIHLPLGSRLFYNDYHHRKETINIRIQIEKHIKQRGYQLDFYDMYFTGVTIPDRKGRVCSTEIELPSGKIKADSIYCISGAGGLKQLYCLEYHNGTEVKRIVEQLKRYVQAMAHGTPSIKYGLSVGNYVLNVFKEEVVMKGVEEQVRSIALFKNFKSHFIFCKIDCNNYLNKCLNTP